MILYTENEGIDGFYEEPIGEKVKNFTPEEIKAKLLKLYKNYDSYRLPVEKIKHKHDWRIIAQEYKKCYESLLY